jgi:hypothetical protein
MTDLPDDTTLPADDEDFEEYAGDTADEVVGPEDDPDRPLGDVLADPNDPRAYPAATED